MGLTGRNTTLAQTPPMGWNSWCGFGKNIHEDLIKEMAGAMVESGMQAVGYEYMIVDDLWHGGRDRSGRLYPDREKFPGGMRALADFVHTKGLKFGLYSDAGSKTCAGAPGSLGWERQDAATFAAWEVDFLKYDYCDAPEEMQSAIRLYSRMSRALSATGRPVVYSICEWGEREPWLWAAVAGGHMWRTCFDLFDQWDSEVNSNRGNGMLMNLDLTAGLAKFAGPGRWNDPDQLIVGLYGKGAIPGPGLTDIEYRSHMSLWCMLAAPLIATCDLRSIHDATHAILTNPEVIAVDQDHLGRQGTRVAKSGVLEIWKKSLQNQEIAVALFNRGLERSVIGAEWEDLGITGAFQARDLWEREDLGIFQQRVEIEVQGHATAMLRLTPYQ